MSPLARTLLSLGALTTAVGIHCNSKMIGYVTNTGTGTSTYDIIPGGDLIYLPKTYYLTDTVGERIVACNKDQNGPPPEIEVHGSPSTALGVVCYWGCPDGATVNVTLYIEDYWVKWPDGMKEPKITE